MTGGILNEEERMLQSMVRDFADRELAPRAREVDEKEEFSWENWRGMVGLGLTGIGIDPAYGGSGGGYRQLTIAIEELARGDSSASNVLAVQLSLPFMKERQKYSDWSSPGRCWPSTPAANSEPGRWIHWPGRVLR
jgi:alkylation response protein AidB-like acyl-CoA dehydrogenase